MTPELMETAGPNHPWRRALLCAAASLPLGLVEGLRVAGNGLRFNSLYAAGGYWRCFSAAATAILFYLALFFLFALLAGILFRAMDRRLPLPWQAMQELAAALALQAGMLVLMKQANRLFPSLPLAVSVLAAWACFLFWLSRYRREGAAPSRHEWVLALSFTASVFAFFQTYLPWNRQYDFVLAQWHFALLAVAAGGAVWLLSRRAAAAIMLLAAALAVLALAGAAGPRVLAAQGTDGGEATPVILITVDTLRRDALSCYGGATATPALDALAAEGVLFERAYAPSPWTLPSLYAMLTSRHPYELRCGGVTEYCLDGDVKTIPAFLAPRYRCRAVVTNLFHTGTKGLWRGFESYESGDFGSVPLDALLDLAPVRIPMRPSPLLTRGYGAARGNQVTRRFLQQLQSLGGGNFFLWAHYMDPHAPYDPPAEFLPENLRKAGGGGELQKMPTMELRQGRATGAEERRLLRGLYAGELRFTDNRLGEVFVFLKSSGLWDKALIVFSADHGEEFWEHGMAGHGHTLYEELLRVPLIIKFPRSGHAGGRVADPVTLLDVLPTILDALDLSVPEDAPFRGRSLMPLVRGAEIGVRPLYFEAPVFYGERKGMLDWPWKAVYDPLEKRGELYHLENDPQERRNLALEHPETMERLLGLMQPYLDAEKKLGGSSPVNGETREKLRALGYLQ